MPLLSVGIPAYKTAYLGQAIASVLAQTQADFELIISDDSPDGSAKSVVERFRDPRIRLIEGPRAGLIANSVRLWEAAQSDYLKFVYDDDFLLPFGLDALLGALQAHPEAGYAFCHRYWVDEAGRVIGSRAAFKGDEPVSIDGAAIARVSLARFMNVVGEPINTMIRRSAFDSSGCLEQFGGLPVRSNIDMAFYLNAALRGPCVTAPGFHAAFRRHENQVSQQSSAPAYGYSFLEWEIFIRGAVQGGLVDWSAAVEGLNRLEKSYARLEPAYPELASFRAGLEPLCARLKTGDTTVLDDAFRHSVMAAISTVDARLDRAAE